MTSLAKTNMFSERGRLFSPRLIMEIQVNNLPWIHRYRLRDFEEELYQQPNSCQQNLATFKPYDYRYFKGLILRLQNLA